MNLENKDSLENEVLKTGLIVITDSNESSFKINDFLVKYLGRKLNSIGLNLSKITFITSLNYIKIIKEVNNYLESNDNNFRSLFVTTTSQQLDPLLKSILNDIHPKETETENISSNLSVYRRFLFLINQEAFHSNVSAVISYIMLNQTWIKLRFLIENKSQLDALKRQNEVVLTELKSRYGNYAVEMRSRTPIELKTDYIFKNNYVNADDLVYNFSSICRSFLSSPELKFLASKFNIDSFCSKIAKSLSIIEQAFKRTSSHQICIAFNGGKDCCVVLYLFYACALRLGFDLPLNLIVISIANPFNEMNQFIFDELKSFYQDSIQYTVLDDTSKTLKEQLFELKASHPSLDYILMGTRRSDAHYYKNMNEFAPTDSGWPSFIRVNPILDWTYSEVWCFIRLLKLPYCELYDRGYTSIDQANNTTPNQALFDSTQGKYLPAYFLPNDDHERTSRL